MSDQFQNLEATTRLFLETLAAQKHLPLREMSIAEARASLASTQAGNTLKLPADIQDDILGTGPTRKIAIRIVRPKGKTSALPIVMFFHGGGWALGDKDTHDRIVREVANRAEAAVIVVD